MLSGFLRDKVGLKPQWLFLAALGACSQLPDGAVGPSVRMDFARPTSFYDAPFPSEELRGADGKIDAQRLLQFPNPDQVEMLSQAMALLIKDAHGFAVSGAIYFALTGDLGTTTLPDAAASTAAESPIFLIDLEQKTRYPVTIHYAASGGPFGAANFLSLLPVQGIPLRPGKVYAAVVKRSLMDSAGRTLGPAAAITQLASGQKPDGLSEAAYLAYRDALVRLDTAGVSATEIAGLAVFTTDSPTATMQAFTKDVLARPLPQVTAPFTAGEIFPDYCVFNSTIDMPDYQQGETPYARMGGGWEVDGLGKPVAPHLARSRIVVTIPRRTMPTTGYPTVLLIRTGAGGDRPLVDRGARAMNGGPAIVAGSGPAQEFARAGFAGVQVDGPLGGLRNTMNADEQFLIFNVFNPTALRDNVRQTALEVVLMAHVLPTLQIAATACPEVSATVRLDGDRLGLMSHSMGSTVAPLVLAMEPLYKVAILSGAGGSYIENIMWKRKPLEVLPLAETLLKYPIDSHLTESDPALTIVQWAAEPADPPIYANQIVREPAVGTAPRHVLMQQGIVDNYIMPNIANATSVSLGLDLAGAPLDENNPRLVGQTPVRAVLPLVGRGQIDLPTAGNLTVAGRRVTAVVVQHAEDGLEDGHEVVFQTAAPKHQYRCFLASFLAGKTPVVPVNAPADAPCP